MYSCKQRKREMTNREGTPAKIGEYTLALIRLFISQPNSEREIKGNIHGRGGGGSNKNTSELK